MALGFNNAPVNFNNSGAILANRSGEIQAQGIASALQSISRGISDYRAQKEEKAQTAAVIEFAKAKGLVRDDKEGAVAVKAAGGPQAALGLMQTLQEMEQRKAAQEQEQQRQAEIARQQAAATAAGAEAFGTRFTGAPLSPEVIQANTDFNRLPPLDKYLRASAEKGVAPSREMLAGLEASQRAGAKPGLAPGAAIDLPGGKKGFWTGAQVAEIKPDKAEEPVLKPLAIGGKKMFVGPGNRYFDEQGTPLDFGRDQPMSATDWILAGQPEDKYLEYRQKFEKAMGRGAAATVPDNSGTIPTIKTAAELAKLPVGSKFIYNGKVGVRK